MVWSVTSAKSQSADFGVRQAGAFQIVVLRGHQHIEFIGSTKRLETVERAHHGL